MQTRNVAAIIFTNEYNEILLQKKDLRFKRWSGRWCMFGGSLEENENPAEAMKREVKEELSYDLKFIELFTVYNYKDKDRQGQMYIYTAPFGAPITSISLGEGAGFAFFSREEIAKLEMISHDKLILKKFFKK